MPSSTQRHRIEIREDIYHQLSDLAAREGYPTSRFADKLLALAMEEYAQARQNGRYPFGHTLLNLAKALLRQGDTKAP
jgi:DNA-binding IclR family transcriptional regulator